MAIIAKEVVFKYSINDSNTLNIQLKQQHIMIDMIFYEEIEFLTEFSMVSTITLKTCTAE